MAWIARAGNAVEHRRERSGIDGGTVGDPRMTARRRRHTRGDPSVEVHERRAEQTAVVDDAAQVARPLRPPPRIRRDGGRVGGRPDAMAVLGTAPMVDAHVGAVLHVTRALRVRVDQRRVAAMVLESRIRVEHLETAARLDPEWKEDVHHLRTVLRVLPEAVVELAEHGAGHVGDDAVERTPALLVHVDVVVDHGAQEPSRLRATVRVGVADRAGAGLPSSTPPCLSQATQSRSAAIPSPSTRAPMPV